MPTTHFVSRTFLKENGLENGLPWDLSSAKKANVAAPVAMVDGGLLQTERIDTGGFMADSAAANGTYTSLIHDASVEDGLTSLQLVLEPVNRHENVDRMNECNNGGGTYAESVAASIFQSSNSVNTQDGDKVTQSKGGKRPTKTFEERIEDLRSYKEKHGHLNVTTKEDYSLYKFCYAVRNARNGSRAITNVRKLTDDQIALLDTLGFDWLPMRVQKTFEERIEDLRSYKEKHGHLNVTTREDHSLYNFCLAVRNARNGSKAKTVMNLTGAQIASLDAIGFGWLHFTSHPSFDERIEDLRSYKEKHGHLSVKRKEDSGLYHFCSRMRKRHNNLDASKKASLDALGFDWLPGKVNKTFEERLEDLRSYYDEHGHLNVTTKEDRGLYQFCLAVRNARNGSKENSKAKKVRKLTDAEIALLDAIGD